MKAPALNRVIPRTTYPHIITFFVCFF